MKDFNGWYIPDSDNPKKLKMILENKFQCEEGLTQAFKYVQNFNNAIDVGSWIGDSSVIIAQKFKNIEVFEPVEAVAECCIKNLNRRNVNNFNFHKIGLSNKQGQQVLVNKGKSFSGWISTIDTVHAKKSTVINTDLLDNFNFSNIDFIKIDVDSHEGFLLQGALNFFKNNNPVIMIESKTKDQQKYQDISMPNPLKLLEGLGYKIKEKNGKADFILTR
jgi:FkbM family methyltransferase